MTIPDNTTKRTFLFAAFILFYVVSVFAQHPTELPDDFDTYNAGEQLVVQNQVLWTTWSNDPGSAEDPYVTSEQANSGANSFVIQEGNDLILPLGDLTSGNYLFNFKILIPTGFTGYYNILHDFNGSNSEWGMQMYFGADGQGTIDAGEESAATFTYEYDTWITIENNINLTYDQATITIDATDYVTWQWSMGTFGDPGLNQLGAANFFAWNEEGVPKYYIDDVELIDIGGTNSFDQPKNLSATIFDDLYVELDWDEPESPILELLWDQIDPLGETYGKSAQDFETGYDVCDAEVASDFVLTEASTINRVSFLFIYNENGVGNVDPRVFNVSIFPDEGGYPGETPLYSTITEAVSPNASNNTFKADLVDPISLEAGTYWIGFNMQLDYDPLEMQCYANQRAAIDNETPGYWRNPGDGFGLGYTTWTQDIESQGGDSQDLCFAIYGVEATKKALIAMKNYQNIISEKTFTKKTLPITRFAKSNIPILVNQNDFEVLGYKIYKNGTLAGQTVDETMFIDGPLESGTYSYLVTAVYEDGESTPAGPVDVTIPMQYPVAIISPNNVIAVSHYSPHASEKEIYIYNEGYVDLEYQFLINCYSSNRNIHNDNNSEILWDNTSDIGVIDNGIISGGYGGLEGENNLINGADDFNIPEGEIWTIEKIYTEGSTNIPDPVDPDGFGVIIYRHAVDKPGIEVLFEEIIPCTNYDEQSLDFAIPLTLYAGYYWVSVYAWFEDGTNISEHRWDWNLGTENVGHEAVLQDQPGFFDGFLWTPIGPQGLGIDYRSLFFNIEGVREYEDQTWLSIDNPSGIVAPFESKELEVTFDSQAIPNLNYGIYLAKIEGYTNDPNNSFVSIVAALDFGYSHPGIDENNDRYILIYPLPSIDILNFQSNETIHSVRILNMAGQEIKSVILDGKEGTINVTDLDAGVYFVKSEMESGTSVQKITVK